MKRGIAKRLLTACLTLGAATALAATAQAQDTSQAGAAPMPQDTAPTGQAQGDTLGGDSTRLGYPVDTTAPQNPPGYQGMERPSNDSLPADSTLPPDSAGAAADSAPDTTAVGDENAREPQQPEDRVHPDSSSQSGAPQ